MAHSDDHFDDFNDDSDRNDEACPFCHSTEGCHHLLATIDETFSQIEGGTFYDFNDKAVEVMNRAIMARLKEENWTARICRGGVPVTSLSTYATC
jgi:hypothetical protein